MQYNTESMADLQFKKKKNVVNYIALVLKML